MHARVAPLQFRPIEGRQTGLIGYLLADPVERAAVVIDPPREQTELILALSEARGVELKYVLRTHAHAVDADACDELCDRTAAWLVAGDEGDESGLGGMAAGRLLRIGDGAALSFGAETIGVIATPGHTRASVSYLWRDRLFCGDAFDMGACAVGGNDSDPAKFFDSLTRRVFVLPEETLVFPAHPMKGRRVATLAELKMRFAQALGCSRDAFITDMACRRSMKSATDSRFW